MNDCESCIHYPPSASGGKPCCFCETKGSLNRYITALYWKQETANNIRIYCNNVYIFNNDVLITVFPLPQKYRSTAQKIKRKESDNDR